MVRTLNDVFRGATSGLMAFLFTAAMVTFLSNQSRQLWLSLSEPTTIHGAIAVTPKIRAGDNITIQYEWVRYRYCDTDINLAIASVAHNELMWSNRVIGGTSLLGEQRVLNHFKTPDDLMPGQYVFRTIVFSRCSDGLHAQSYPEVEFEVIKGD